MGVTGASGPAPVHFRGGRRERTFNLNLPEGVL